MRELTGAEAALVVNNCAAAVLLAAAALAGGRELVVSRGQLVEIGGSFRIPEVVAQSGARLRRGGHHQPHPLARLRARARTGHRRDPARAPVELPDRRASWRRPEIEELCSLGGVPVIDDVGSGALAEAVPELAGEPAIRRSVAAGCAVVCFSGDKLLGGPQAGLMAGTREAVERCRSHPLARARAHRQALARRARGHASPVPRRRAGRGRNDPGAAHAHAPRRKSWAHGPSGCGRRWGRRHG